MVANKQRKIFDSSYQTQSKSLRGSTSDHSEIENLRRSISEHSEIGNLRRSISEHSEIGNLRGSTSNDSDHSQVENVRSTSQELLKESCANDISIDNVAVISDSPDRTYYIQSTPVSEVFNPNVIPYHNSETFWNVLSQASQADIDQSDAFTQMDIASDGVDAISQTISPIIEPVKIVEVPIDNTNICEDFSAPLSCTFCGKDSFKYLYRYYYECRKDDCECCKYYCERCKVEGYEYYRKDRWILLVNKNLT
jgi:hypothetical protein